MKIPYLLVVYLMFGTAADTRAQRTDQLGDPLPKGALARMSTARLRQKINAAKLAFSPDGKLLASTPIKSSMVHIWDANSGKEVRVLPTGNVTALTFAPDSNSLAIGDTLG